MNKEAEKLIKKGFVIIPCYKNKTPAIKEWTIRVTLDNCLENIQEDKNIGILTGEKSGITVIDIDVKDNGLEVWKKLITKYGDIETPKVQTGTGGYHYYFKYYKNINSDSKVVKYDGYKTVGIDIKNDGGYVIAPPSVNENGNSYKWINLLSKKSLKEIPSWFFDYLINKKKVKKTKIIQIKDKTEDESDKEFSEESVECNNMYNKNHVQKLLFILKQDRCDDHKTWIKVGMCLHNNEEDYFYLWKKWSKKSSRYTKGCCENNWKTFEKGEKNLTLKSLHYWAKKDNIDEYNLFKREECIEQFIHDHKNEFPNELQKIQMGKILVDNNTCTAMIKNNNCLLNGIDHNEPKNYIELLNTFGGRLICKDTICDGQYYKKQIFAMSENVSRGIFGNNQPIIVFGDIVNNKQVNKFTNGDGEENILICDNYKIFDDDELNKFIMKSLNNTPYDIAKVLWYLTKNNFKCTKHKEWYMYKDHRWTIDDIEIRDTISNLLAHKYEKVLKFYETLKNDKDLHLKVGKIINLITSLKKTATKNNILTEACDIFYREDREFSSKLDSNIYLLGFNNGVYDLIKMKFREGLPEDNITMSVGYNYDSSQKEPLIEKMISEILPNEDLRKYILKLFGYCLSGCTKLQKFFCFSGEGSNGKSLLIELLGKTLGEYYCSVPISLITQKRGAAESASPQLQKTINKRLITFAETNKDDVLNLGLMKELTGGDKVNCRGLHQDPIEFKPHFKSIFLCNILPKIDANQDYSVWRRMRRGKFISTFNDDPVGPNEYKKDDSLSENFDKWRPAFMNILLEYYRIYKIDGLKDIKEIMDSTNEYKNDENVYTEFIDTYIKKTDNKDDYIVWTELKDKYEKWFQKEFYKNPPKSKEIKNYFEKYVFMCEMDFINVQIDKKWKKIRGWNKFLLL
jgi:P4 family phage/plasmid primase-like protien